MNQALDTLDTRIGHLRGRVEKIKRLPLLSKAAAIEFAVVELLDCMSMMAAELRALADKLRESAR